MGLYRKTTTRPLPPGAVVSTKRSGRRVARWTTRNGARTAEVTGDGTRIRTESATWYGRIVLADGTRKEVNTGCRDRSAAAAQLAALQSEQDRLRAGVVTEAEISTADAGRRPLADVGEAFVRMLADKGRSAKHVAETARYLERARLGLGWRTLADMEGDALNGWLAEQGFGARVCNAFVAAHKAFSAWARRRGWLSRDPFAGMELRNREADRRHVRRALTAEELDRLYDAAERRPLEEALRGNRGQGKAMGKKEAEVSPAERDRLAWLGWTRSIIYRTAANTGLRLKELRSLRLGSCRLDHDPPYIILEAADAKSRRGAQVPVSGALAGRLRDYIKERRARLLRGREELPGVLDGMALFEAMPREMSKVFARDCETAGIERADSAGRVVDFHALRHSYATALAKAGVNLQTAQRLMRHSDPRLTSATYTHLGLIDMHAAVEKLPQATPVSVAQEVAQNSGTGGQKEAIPGNGTPARGDSSPGDTIRTSANNDRACQDVAGKEDGVPGRNRTRNLLVRSQTLMSRKSFDSSTYEGGETSVAREVARDHETGALEALRGMPREELVGLLLEVLGKGGPLS